MNGSLAFQPGRSGAVEVSAEARPCRLVALAAFGLGIILIARSLVLIATGVSALPYWDQWEIYERAQAGQLSPWSLGTYIAQHNEHRLLTSMPLYLVDMLALAGRNQLGVAAVVVACLALAVVMWRVARTRNPWQDAALLALLGAGLLSLAHRENLTWGFQPQFPFVYLFAALATVFASRLAMAEREVSSYLRPLLGLTVCTALSVLSMANGLLVLIPVVVVLGLQRASWDRWALGLAVYAAAALAFFHDYAWTPSGYALPSIADAATYCMIYLGAPFSKDAVSAMAVGLVGISLFSCLAVTVAQPFFMGRRPGSSEIILVALGLFVLASVLLTAAGRADRYPNSALWSRYALPALIFWLSIGGLAYRRFGLSGRWGEVGRTVVLALLAVAVAVSTLRPDAAANVNRHRIALDKAAFYFISDVYDEDAMAAASYFPLDRLRRTAEYLRQNNLSVFSRQAVWYQPPPRTAAPASEMPTCAAYAVSSVTRLASGDYRLRGWIIDARDRVSADWVRAVSENGEPLGITRPLDPDPALGHRFGTTGLTSFDLPVRTMPGRAPFRLWLVGTWDAPTRQACAVSVDLPSQDGSR